MEDDSDDVRYDRIVTVLGVAISALLNFPCCRPQDLPEDLTPFITRTNLDPASTDGGFGDVWKCKCKYSANDTFVSPCIGFNLPCNWLTGTLIDKVAVKAFRLLDGYDLEKINRVSFVRELHGIDSC
jgi:hypothetical protein